MQGRVATNLAVVAAVIASVFATAGVLEARAAGGRVVSIADGRYRRHVFNNVTVDRDVQYREVVGNDGEPTPLRLDVYQGADDKASGRAAIIWMHPGGFTSGNKFDMATYADDAALRGYVGISIDYRLRPQMDWFDTAQREQAARDADADGTAAVDWVRAHADDYGIDPSHIFVGGYSAGAIMAFDLAYPPDGVPLGIAGAISISGYSYDAPEQGAPPVIAFHGTSDPLVPYAYDAHSCGMAAGADHRCVLVTLDGAGHEIGTTLFGSISEQVATFAAGIIDPH